jgi:hypothetical protein
MANLRASGIPLPMLSAHLPEQYARVRAGALAADPAALAVDKVRDVLRAYAAACSPARPAEDTLAGCEGDGPSDHRHRPARSTT